MSYDDDLGQLCFWTLKAAFGEKVLDCVLLRFFLVLYVV